MKIIMGGVEIVETGSNVTVLAQRDLINHEGRLGVLVTHGEIPDLITALRLLYDRHVEDR